MADVRHAWLQKHPSPSASGGEFHWHPGDRDRELRASCVERLRGIEPPAVLWQLAPGHVSWAQLFAATAPYDRRKYVGVVLTVVEGDGSVADLLDQLVIPPAAPWSDGVAPVAGTLVREVGDARGVAAIARALLSGGSAIVDDPESPGLPRRIASIERILPPAIAETTRRGVFRAQGIGHARDRVGELASAAWADSTSHAAVAWRVLCDLASGDSPPAEAIDRVARQADGAETALRDALSPAERAAIGARDGAVDVVHAWGRGRLDRCSAADLVERLADAVALRVLARLLRDRDPASVVAEVRWHALLPAAHRNALLAAVARRSPALRHIVSQAAGASQEVSACAT